MESRGKSGTFLKRRLEKVKGQTRDSASSLAVDWNYSKYCKLPGFQGRSSSLVPRCPANATANANCGILLYLGRLYRRHHGIFELSSALFEENIGSSAETAKWIRLCRSSATVHTVYVVRMQHVCSTYCAYINFKLLMVRCCYYT
jgi:hypothetical protein